MGVWKSTLAIVLLFFGVAVYTAHAGIISEQIRAKRSYEYNCEEKVLSRTPDCRKTFCPNGQNGRPEEMFYECPKLPKLCPMKISDDKAECCPDRCVCSDGQNTYEPGDKFMLTRDGEQWDCVCENDKVPKCESGFTVPPKEPPRPPPKFPPPRIFPPPRETE